VRVVMSRCSLGPNINHGDRRPGDQRPAHGFGVAGNDPEIGARGLIGLGGALLPIPERAEGNLKAGGKFLLREAERAPDQLGANVGRPCGEND
jgi:hypothetical protein